MKKILQKYYRITRLVLYHFASFDWQNCIKKEILQVFPKHMQCFNQFSRPNKEYVLQMDTGKLPVYCNMDGDGLGECGGGGWTLVMKIDGTKVYFKRLCLKPICFERDLACVFS